MAKKKVGRPIGYRKKDARRYTIDVRLTLSQMMKLRQVSKQFKITRSDIIRYLIDNL